VSVVSNLVVNVDSSNAVSKLKQVQQGAQATSQAVDKLNATNDALAASFTKSGKPIQTAANGMRFFTDATGRARKVNGQFVTTAEAAAAGIQKQGRAAQQTAGKLNGLRSAVVGLGSAFGGIAAVLGVIQAGRFVFAKTADVESQSRSLAILAGSAEKAGQIIKELQQLGAVTPFTSTELIDSAKRLQAFGVEADKVVETTRRLADASGATGAELSGLVTAYGQVQAKGRLQGEELLQFQERGIALQEELRKMYGMTAEEFQKALEKGQISAKAVEVALVNLTSTGGKYANGAIAQSDTLSGRLSTLQDNVDGVAREVGKVLTPALIEILQQLNTSLSQTPAFVEDIALAFQYAAGQIAPFLNGLSQMQWFFTNLTPPGWAMQIIGGASERGKSTIRNAASRQRQSQKNAFIGPAAPQMQGPAIPERLRQKPNNLPPPLMIPSATASGGGGGRAAGGGGASKAADEAKRLAEELQRSVERGNDLFRQFSRQAVLLGTTSETERKRLQIQYEYQDRVREINELKDAEQKVNLMAVNDEIRRLQTLELQTEELKKQLEVFYELAGLSMGEMLPGGAGAFRTDVNLDPNDRAQQKIDEYKTKLTELQDPINMAQRGAQGIGDAFSSSFQGIITGTQTAQEALASFFQNIAKSFLDMATEIIAQMVIMYAFKQLLGLFGGGAGIAPSNNFSGAFSGTTASFNPSSFGMGLLPGRAKGGPVSSGQTYMVGERGPELFVPGRSGTIVANDKMGGGNTNVVVNVDAKGSSVEGDEQGANQLGRVISAAVQSELIKQQRPGGILAR
jgi:tape measure domain-containing protein